MTRNADRTGSARPAIGPRLFLATLALLAGAVPALAGDRAQLDIIGYSEDAHYFAFEEYGIADGAGAAYANVFIIDLTKDAWVGGSPFRVAANDENASLASIRAKAMAAAQKPLKDLAIDTPGEIVALIGDGALDKDAKTLEFGTPRFIAPGEVDGDYTLTLSMFDADSAEPCATYTDGDKAKGFGLTLSGLAPTQTLIHKDTKIPASRGCPQNYRLYGVAVPMDGDVAQGVALVSVYPLGFEGPDRRFVAVPLTPAP